MESLRKLIDIVEQGRLPAPMEPTYKKDPGGQLVPDIDVNLNPDMKSTQPRTPAPSTLPPLDAPMEPTYKKGPGGQLVPDIDYKLNPGMKPQSGTAAPPKPASRPQPAAPRTTPKMPTVPQPGTAVKKITEHDIDQEVAAIIEEINKLSTTGVAEGQGSKPDYIDLDGDGNRKETMKKAAADRKHQKSAK